MLKKLYEEGYLLIENLLIQKYQNLQLNAKELMILLLLFSSYKKKIFSSTFLTEKTHLSKNEVEEILENLIKKKFFNLYCETRDNKITEVFSLDQTFEQIEQLYLHEIKEKIAEQKRTVLAETIDILENAKKTILNSYELEIIKSWYQDKKYDHQKILSTIQQADKLQKTSVNYIEKLLNQETFYKIENDEKADKIMEKIFKKIK